MGLFVNVWKWFREELPPDEDEETTFIISQVPIHYTIQSFIKIDSTLEEHQGV